MKTLQPREVGVPTYHLKDQKPIGVSYSRAILRVHQILRHGIGPSHYCTHRRDLSNNLSRDPNRDDMEKLPPQEVDVRTYHASVHKSVGVSCSMIIFRVHNRQRNCVGPFHYWTPCQDLSKGPSSNPNGDYQKMLVP